MKLKVSVILATYNQVDLLKRAIQSINSQRFIDFELIVINDGSTDETGEYLEYLKKDTRYPDLFIVINNESNLGAIPSYNKGFVVARGEYVTFISSDNWYDPEWLESLVKALDENQDAAIAYSGFYWVNGEGTVLRENKKVNFTSHNLLLGNPGIASFLIRKKFLFELQQIFLDSSVGIAADTDLWTRLTEEYPKVIYVDKNLCRFLWDSECESFKKFDTTWDSVDKVVKNAMIRRRYRLNPNSLRILFTAPNFPPYSFAGVEVYTYSIAKELISRGHKVSLLIPKYDPGEAIELYDYEGIEVYRISSPNFSDYSSAIKNPPVSEKFVELLDSKKIDIFHIHHTMGFPMSIIEILKRCGYPVIITLHDFWTICHRVFMVKSDGESARDLRKLDECVSCLLGPKGANSAENLATHYYLTSLRRYYAKQMLLSSDLVTAPSEYIQKVYSQLGVPVQLKPLGILDLPWKEKRERTNLVFGFLGVLHEIKRVEQLINTFKRSSDNKNAILEIWGASDQEYMIRLKKLECSNVLFMGSYAPGQLPDILSGIDYLIIPSSSETYSLVAREAIASRTPLIIRYTGALIEIEKLSKGGCITFSRDEGLGGIIEFLIEDWGKGKKEFNALRMRIDNIDIPTIKKDAEEWIKTYLQFSETERIKRWEVTK